jgi:hypothetical protein
VLVTREKKKKKKSIGNSTSPQSTLKTRLYLAVNCKSKEKNELGRVGFMLRNPGWARLQKPREKKEER